MKYLVNYLLKKENSDAIVVKNLIKINPFNSYKTISGKRGGGISKNFVAYYYGITKTSDFNR
ncbi:hypothetical protein A8C32_08270 [Flavivirga aquatica]|uniref:Uncharacterized protein n=1 Tax=Flavivirga aquatica TaxID=1849968 RepID=A0A1E5SJ50_9FLAO|nr:hypothetical protein A8C32_08270 [Flavivirga aquatica]